MKPIEFPEHNIVYAKDQKEYIPLPALRYNDQDGTVIFCQQLTLKERFKLLFTGKIWVSFLTFHRALTPSFHTVNKSDVITTEPQSSRAKVFFYNLIKRLWLKIKPSKLAQTENSQYVINQEKADEHRERFLYFFKKTILRIRDEARGNPIYLIRYSIFACRWFSVKLHRIMLSDDDCSHDHPWSFLSVILWGGYWEWTPYEADKPAGKFHYVAWKGFGSILWRPAPSVHRLELREGKTATTLVVTFKRVREWGFYTSKGWTKWSDYIRSGAKCE